MRIRFLTLMSLLVEDGDPKGGWKYFHITHDDHGDVLVLKPQVPINASKYVENEDFTTPRVSLARSVNDAIVGKFGSYDLAQPEMYVYASKDVDVIVPKECPFSHDMSWSSYAHENGMTDDEKTRARVVHMCAPDAHNQAKFQAARGWVVNAGVDEFIIVTEHELEVLESLRSVRHVSSYLNATWRSSATSQKRSFTTLWVKRSSSTRYQS